MVYESFFDTKLLQAKTDLGRENRIPSLLMRIGAKAMDQAMGMSDYTHGFTALLDINTGSNTNIDINMDTNTNINTKINTSEFPVQNWLIWHLHDCLAEQIGSEQLGRYMGCLARAAWDNEDKFGHICYFLPFLAYYESRWNERKGYGELVILAKKTAKSCLSEEGLKENKAVLGSFMAAMAQCYEEMTEEAYDQREVFADFLKSFTKTFQERWKLQTKGCSQDSVLAAYAIIKGIRLGILHYELYGKTAKEILTAMEAEGFILKDGAVCLGEETEENSYERAMQSMMAYGEYIKLRKERPYYGI